VRALARGNNAAHVNDYALCTAGHPKRGAANTMQVCRGNSTIDMTKLLPEVRDEKRAKLVE
jgi:hypothetical protein